MDIPELFGLLAGKRLHVFAFICETECPISAKCLAEGADIALPTARVMLRNMSLAGLVVRAEGSFDSVRGRHPDLFVAKPRVKDWWKVTKETFRDQSNGEQVPQHPAPDKREKVRK
jgi:hypothetical protein